MYSICHTIIIVCVYNVWGPFELVYKFYYNYYRLLLSLLCRLPFWHGKTHVISIWKRKSDGEQFCYHNRALYFVTLILQEIDGFKSIERKHEWNEIGFIYKTNQIISIRDSSIKFHEFKWNVFLWLMQFLHFLDIWIIFAFVSVNK